jgi:hypothetical protein
MNSRCSRCHRHSVKISWSRKKFNIVKLPVNKFENFRMIIFILNNRSVEVRRHISSGTMGKWKLVLSELVVLENRRLHEVVVGKD